jgi:hypothetical protein
MTVRQWALSFAALLLLASCASVPRSLGGHGAIIDAYLRDGRTLTGELLAVRSGSLFILDKAGRDQILALSDSTAVRVRNRSRVFLRAGNGFMIGFAAGVVGGYAFGGQYGGLASGVLGVIGAGAGIIVGGLSGIPAPGKTLTIGPDAVSVDSAAEQLRAVARFPSER